MRSQWPTLCLLIPVLAILFAGPPGAGAVPSLQADAGLDGVYARDATTYAYPYPAITKRDGMGHGHEHGHAMAAPLTELDEDEILRWNGPTPPSYWTIDVEEGDPNVQRYPWLMALHVLFMSIAFFGALPAGKCGASSRSIHCRRPICEYQASHCAP